MKTDTQLLQEIQRLATTAAARSEVLGSALFVDVEAILAVTNLLLGSLSSQGYDIPYLILHKSQLTQHANSSSHRSPSESYDG